jgi:aminopeptidase 2
LSTKDGKSTVDRTAILQTRETTITLDTSKPFKLNGGTTGVCASYPHFPLHILTNPTVRVLYTPERLSKIAAQAAEENSVFSLDDRMGLAQDAFALSQAGFAKLSSALTVVNLWKHEQECKWGTYEF